MRYLSVCSGIEAATVAWGPLGWKAAAFSEIERFPRAVLKHRFPDVPLHGDFTTIGKDDYGPIDLLCGGTPCFTSETLILCSDGLKSIADVEIGDMVLTHKNRYRKVLAVGSKPSATIEVRGQGARLQTTTEHPIYCRSKTKKWNNEIRQYRREFSEPHWVEAGECKGEFWASPSKFPASDIPPIESFGNEKPVKEITPELMRVIGRWLGDGWIRSMGLRRSYVIICGNKNEQEVIADEIESAGLHASVSQERTTVRFQIASKSLARWISSNFGRLSKGKRIPSWAFGMPLKFRKALKDGYVSADGTKKVDHESVTSVNKSLIIGFVLLQNTLGQSTTVTKNIVPPTKIIEGRTVNQSDFWIARSFKKPRSSFDDGSHRYGLVRSVQDNEGQSQVFNVEVEGDNSYVADGIVVHNCQSFSIAGLRGGLDDDRGNLSLEFVRLAQRKMPRWICWENVPGVLSSNEGRDFGAFLGALAELGFGFAYRIFDAQFVRVQSHPFAVPQRRRRVFVVGHIDNDWQRAAAVLFERESVCGHPPPSRESGQNVAGTTSARTKGGGGLGTDFEIGGGLIAGQCNGTNFNPVGTLRAGNGNETGGVPIVMSSGQANAGITNGFSPTLNVNRDGAPIAFTSKDHGQDAGEVSPTLRSMNHAESHANGGGQVAVCFDERQVRRLTPLECERFQGLPDDFTKVPYRGKPADQCPDGSRYKAIGNSMAVNCMSWIGQRIQLAEKTGGS